ncbi:MAG: DUF1573 domain-containing protein [Crocinitomicaceae bacterium]|nr:DUF1573 domain-containing protein [Crocinitomicaceae bacterium]MBK8924823.1 DUF1573 domain-containing protein [Crocinitomicaceae bacterium]
MKKAIFTLSLLVVAMLGLNSYAQEVGSNGPVLTIDKETHDYGTLEQGGNGECVFVVTNTGNEPLLIQMCKGSCGCTVPSCPQEPIAPGASAKITVKYDTNRVGPINKTVTITSNAVNSPSKMIYIRGNIVAKPAEGGTTTPTN